MEVDAAKAARAQAILAANGTDAKAHELDRTDIDMPIAVLSKLMPSHYYEVSEWGELLVGDLRRSNSRARFTLFIRGEHIIAKTNQPLDIVAAVVTANANKLRHDLPSVVTITFDPALAERIATSDAK